LLARGTQVDVMDYLEVEVNEVGVDVARAVLFDVTADLCHESPRVAEHEGKSPLGCKLVQELQMDENGREGDSFRCGMRVPKTSEASDASGRVLGVTEAGLPILEERFLGRGLEVDADPRRNPIREIRVSEKPRLFSRSILLSIGNESRELLEPLQRQKPVWVEACHALSVQPGAESEWSLLVIRRCFPREVIRGSSLGHDPFRGLGELLDGLIKVGRGRRDRGEDGKIIDGKSLRMRWMEGVPKPNQARGDLRRLNEEISKTMRGIPEARKGR
jgi:hypothetical protein